MSTILAVAQRGETILSLAAAEVAKSELNSEWLSQLAKAMHDTMCNSPQLKRTLLN